MSQVEQATSKKGKRYLTNTVVEYDEINANVANLGYIKADDIETGTISADKISGGTLTLGGLDNGNGLLSIKNSSGTSIVTLNNGGITLADGASIVGENGILSVFKYEFKGQQNAEYFSTLGFTEGIGAYVPATLVTRAYIPSNFVITEAKIIMYHRPMYIANIPVVGSQWCYSRKVKLYKANTITGGYSVGTYSSEYSETGVTYSEITSAFGTNGFTATKPSVNPPSVPSNPTQLITSTDIKSSLTVGSDNNLIIKSTDTCTSEADMLTKTGQAIATLVVIGYKK